MKRFRHLLKTTGPYLAALGILVLLRSTGWQTLDLVIYDLITSQRSEGSGQEQPITLVGIESDIQRFGWPIDDGIFCEAVDALNAGGVTAIGFDIYRDKGVGEQQQCLRDRFRDEPTLVSIFNVAAGIAPVPGTPLERQSYNDLSLDADGVVRRDLVHVTEQDEATVAFPLRVLEVATGDRSLQDARNQVRIKAHGCRQMVGDITTKSMRGLGCNDCCAFTTRAVTRPTPWPR